MKNNCCKKSKSIQSFNKIVNYNYKIVLSAKNLFLILITFLISINSIAQNKKEQILILTSQVDSLIQVINVKNSLIEKNLINIDNLERKNNENNIIQSNLRNELFLLNLNIDSILNILDSNKIEIQSKNNQILSLKNHEFKSPNLIYDCKGALGNSSSYYPFRMNGEMNGCIGKKCQEVPTDMELHSVILNISKDFNNDGIIDVMDLQSAIMEVGDINGDGKKDIYDINYPNKIKYTKTTINPQLIKDDQITSYYLSGKISDDGKKIILSAPIDILYPNLGEGGDEYARDEITEIYIAVGGEISLYKNKNIVVKGKIHYGITQSYIDGFIFEVEEIIGITK